MSVRGTAKELKIPPGTAQTWYTKGQKSIESGEDLYLRKPGSGRPVERPFTINSEQKEYLVNLIDQKPGIVLDEIMEGLTCQFTKLDISRSSLYKYVTTHCGMSVKRALFRPAERNSDAKIEARFQWVTELLKTDIDYMTNCVFIDKLGFNINMKSSMAWAPVGETPIVEIPKTRATSHTIIGAISPLGVVNVQLKVPKVVVVSNSKKEKRARHYFNFVSETIQIMNQYEEFRGHYLIMDNYPIHNHVDIRKYIETHDYGCVYLPPYSPELNPIEQFWSVLVSMQKEACNNVLTSDLQGFL
ncbi:hypothetical protein G6F56_010494 [Rhizopus delemar]|nr:hypothetical protein G6F56_010494 [Rhizopus delemar]